MWNDFRDDVLKSESNKIIFNAKLKGQFIDQLNANYVCTRLLCPHCHLNNGIPPYNNDVQDV
jgi:cytochrome c